MDAEEIQSTGTVIASMILVGHALATILFDSAA